MKKKTTKKKAKKKTLKHRWFYRGGECKCLIHSNCFLQPDGRITKRA